MLGLDLCTGLMRTTALGSSAGERGHTNYSITIKHLIHTFTHMVVVLVPNTSYVCTAFNLIHLWSLIYAFN